MGYLPVAKDNDWVSLQAVAWEKALMGMIARNSEAEVNVIALIGERGREVREFIENV